MNISIISNGSQHYVHADDGANPFTKLRGTFSTREDAVSFKLALLYDKAPDEIARVLLEAAAEIHRARITLGFPPMRSAHEGFAVIMEEFDELKAHVWMNQKKRDIAAMRAEAIQVAAMALCFAAEVCNEETGRK